MNSQIHNVTQKNIIKFWSNICDTIVLWRSPRSYLPKNASSHLFENLKSAIPRLLARNTLFLDREMALLIINFQETTCPLVLFSPIYTNKLSSNFGYLAGFSGWSFATWGAATNSTSFFYPVIHLFRLNIKFFWSSTNISFVIFKIMYHH